MIMIMTTIIIIIWELCFIILKDAVQNLAPSINLRYLRDQVLRVKKTFF